MLPYLRVEAKKMLQIKNGFPQGQTTHWRISSLLAIIGHRNFKTHSSFETSNFKSSTPLIK
jgi:hypothetical protein